MKKEGESVDFTDCKISAEVRMTNVSGEKVNNRAQDYYKMLLFLNESTNDTFLLWDMERDIVYFSRQLTVLIGQEYKDGVPDDIFAYKLEIIKDIVYRNDMPKVERAIRHVTRGTDERMDLNFRYVDKHGKKFWVNCRGNVLNEGGKEQPLMIGCLSRRVLSEKVDMLTGLMNYNKMLENVEKGIAKGKRGHMLILGIDDFREINQCMGRDYGNQVLKTVAEVLEEIKNEKSSVYRMDGDHFGVDLAGCSKRETVDFFERLQKRTESMCEFSGGAVCYPYNENEKDMSALVSYAENALMQSKKNGKNRLSFFSSDDYKENASRMELLKELRESIRNNFEGFELYYQLQVTSNGYRLKGAEALLRYHSKQRGFMSPVVFIPLLEQTELIIPVGKWVMRQAFAQCALWRKKYGDFNISINISYIQLKDKSIVQNVINAAKEAKLPGNAITLEVTESMQLQDYNYFNSMFYYWKEKGMQISIDDFGTGYSSLSYLKGLEVDEVKIDRCFVRQIHKSSYNYRLLSNMLELTQEAQIRVCCEGVEEEEELRCLDTLSPELIQGYFFGKPMSADEFESTCLATEGSYNKFVTELRKRYHDHPVSARTPESASTESIEYKNILDSLKSIIYVVDKENLEILYMNAEAKKITGIYNYLGCKCFQVFTGRAEQCEECAMNNSEDVVNITSKMFYDLYGRKMYVSEKNILWHQREARLITALPVDGKDGPLNQKLNQDLYVAEKIIQMYELVQSGEKDDGILEKLVTFTGKYYQADRASLFLLDESLELWEDVATYHDQGVMDKERYLEVTTQAKIQPWLDYIRKNKVIYIKDRESLKEIDETLYKGFLEQDAQSCLLCGIWHEEQLLGFISIDNPEMVVDRLALLCKTAFLVEQVLLHNLDNNGARTMLHKLVENKLNHNILSVSGVGLWQMKIDKVTGDTTILADENMKKLLGVDKDADPAKCYQAWVNKIAEEYLDYVKDARDTMMVTDKTAQIEYKGFSPQHGKVTIRCVGTKTSENEAVVTIDGYYRILEDMLQIRK